MMKSNKLKSYSKLILLLVLIISMGIVACRGDKDSSQEEWKYVGDLRNQKGEYISVYIDLNNMEIEEQLKIHQINF